MAEPALKLMTVADFMEFGGDGTDTRYELIGGAPVAMNPPKGPHVEITTRLLRTLFAGLQPPCRPLVGGGVAKSLDSFTYRIPDIFVSCTAASSDAYFDEPRLIVEILSPSTEGEDRTAKLDFYKTFPSLQTILLVWQDTRRVEMHRRIPDGWLVTDQIGSGAVIVDDLGLTLGLEAIYAD